MKKAKAAVRGLYLKSVHVNSRGLCNASLILQKQLLTVNRVNVPRKLQTLS